MITNRKDYYSASYILLEMVKLLKFRYLSVRKDGKDKAIMVRYYMGYSLDLFKKSLDKLNVLNDKSCKLYYDLALWKDKSGITPLFNYDDKKRESDKDKFVKNIKDYFKGYDFAIDIDAESIEEAYKDTKKIKDLFDTYKLPYSLKFSGGRGFHFIIDNKWFGEKKNYMNQVSKLGKLGRIIMTISGLKSINDGGTFDDTIYDFRRVFKLPYSLQYKGEKEYVCLPLDDEQFKCFNLEDMEMMNVMRKVKIMNRGMLERNYGLSEKELKENLKRFMKECNL